MARKIAGPVLERERRGLRAHLQSFDGRQVADDLRREAVHEEVAVGLGAEVLEGHDGHGQGRGRGPAAAVRQHAEGAPSATARGPRQRAEPSSTTAAAATRRGRRHAGAVPSAAQVRDKGVGARMAVGRRPDRARAPGRDRSRGGIRPSVAEEIGRSCVPRARAEAPPGRRRERDSCSSAGGTARRRCCTHRSAPWRPGRRALPARGRAVCRSRCRRRWRRVRDRCQSPSGPAAPSSDIMTFCALMSRWSEAGGVHGGHRARQVHADANGVLSA